MKKGIFRNHDAAKDGGGHDAGSTPHAQGKEHRMQRLKKNEQWVKEGAANLAEALEHSDITQEEHDMFMQQNEFAANFIAGKIAAE